MTGDPENVEPQIHGDRVGVRVCETASHRLSNVRRCRLVADTEETAGERDDDVKREHASMGRGARVVTRNAAGALEELVAEAALSGTRFPGDHNDSWLPRLCLAERALEDRELALAAHEAREATRSRAVEAARDPARTTELEDADGSAGALEALLPTVEEVEEVRRDPRRLIGHRDAARWRKLLHAGRQPDDMPLRGVVHAQVVADAAHDHLPGVQAHPHRELEPALTPHVLGERAELACQVQSGRTGALGVVFVGDRGAEERHDAVPGVLVDRALVPVNAVRKDAKQAIEEAVPLLGIDALGELHRPYDVGEEHGDQLALAPERALRRKDLLDEMPRRVGARLASGCRGLEVRATLVAEARAARVLVSTDLATHRGQGSVPSARLATAARRGVPVSIEFLVTSLVIVISPGTGVLYTLAAGLSRGFRASVVAAFGCTLGIVPHMAAAIMGLAALLHTSALAFQTLKYLGVAYLLYMAWSTLKTQGALTVETEPGVRSARRVVVSAILINILNPKLSIFFFAFLPQFVSADEARPLAHMLTLSAVFMTLTFVVFVGYGFFAVSMRKHVIARPRVLTWMQRAFAGAFVALGAKLAFADR